MRISEEEIRKLTLTAIEELGKDATPELVKNVVAAAVQKASDSDEISLPDQVKSSGRVILTSFGLNKPGVVATVTNALSDADIDIRDMSQNIMEEFFTMIMIVDISNSPKSLSEIQKDLNKIAEDLKIKIYCQHEDLFQAMYRI